MARLLVVEDNPTTSRVLSLYLSGAGHRVREAATLAEAVFEAAMFHPEVIVLSAACSAESVLQLLAETKRWDLRPKVVLTALRGNEEECRELLKAGVCDYVIKSSYFQNTLIEKVNQALTQREADLPPGKPLDPDLPSFKPKELRDQNPPIPVHLAFNRRKSRRSWPPGGPGGSV